MSDNELANIENIQNRIYTIRGVQVMLDEDLAFLYDVETRVLNQSVKRNMGRFPERFCFKLNPDEYELLRSQIVILEKDDALTSQIVISSWGGREGEPCPMHSQSKA